MTVKKIKIKRKKEKLKLIAWSLVSASVLTLFLTLINLNVDPSFFDIKVLSRDILGVHETLYRVVRVVDGDTFVVDRDGGDVVVRLLGVDTPETQHPQEPVECFGREAAARLHELLEDQYVRLEGDASQADIDRYGRLLRYVYLPDGTLVNQLLIKEGYAFEYTYDKPYALQNQFNTEEDMARIQGRGLWGENGCAIGDRD
jgi:micrococcal nuclease